MLLSLIFSQLWSYLTLPSPIMQYEIQGEKESISREENLWNSLHIFNPWGQVYPNEVLSTHPFHVIPVLVLLWFPELALIRVFLCYLTLFSQVHLLQS